MGSSSSPAAAAPIPGYRSTLLLTLLSALSLPLYATPISLRQQPSPVLAHLSTLPRKTYLALLCSLLNTALTPPPTRYIGQVTRDEDLYPQRATQALLVLLCQESDRPNVYQKAIAKLHREQDFEFIIEGVKNALDAEAAKGGLVNGVTKAVPVGRRGKGPGALDVWLLIWRIIDLNKVSFGSGLTEDYANSFTRRNRNLPTISSLLLISLRSFLIFSLLWRRTKTLLHSLRSFVH